MWIDNLNDSQITNFNLNDKLCRQSMEIETGDLVIEDSTQLTYKIA